MAGLKTTMALPGATVLSQRAVREVTWLSSDDHLAQAIGMAGALRLQLPTGVVHPLRVFVRFVNATPIRAVAEVEARLWACWCQTPGVGFVGGSNGDHRRADGGLGDRWPTMTIDPIDRALIVAIIGFAAVVAAVMWRRSRSLSRPSA